MNRNDEADEAAKRILASYRARREAEKCCNDKIERRQNRREEDSAWDKFYKDLGMITAFTLFGIAWQFALVYVAGAALVIYIIYSLLWGGRSK